MSRRRGPDAPAAKVVRSPRTRNRRQDAPNPNRGRAVGASPSGRERSQHNRFRTDDGPGATGRTGDADDFEAAPKTRHGRAWWHGGEYAAKWYTDHRGEVTKRDVTVEEVGVAFFYNHWGRFDQPALPGAGPVDWDRTFGPEAVGELTDSDDALTHDLDSRDRYRVGAHVVTESGRDLGWECVDFTAEPETKDGTPGYYVSDPWKVSPRI
ncbi:hypothetical protein [Halorussus sp. MSC15.2]|uniref:hypothetical protein n=1 Tax=Halorussus sp. MSC15.2 TaxID=2283638 RepID=UPI0013D1FC94|nr:hypothetical protein [Halorussus sp. MSC15.2]NEU58124.1 hypothetical protein [Halorussus sp. MSC15.2]